MKDYALTPEEIVNSIDLDKERMYFDGKGSCVSTFDLTNLLKEQVAKVLKMMSEDIHAPCESKDTQDNCPYLEIGSCLKCYEIEKKKYCTISEQ